MHQLEGGGVMRDMHMIYLYSCKSKYGQVMEIEEIRLN